MAFDPLQPFAAAASAAFDPSKPFSAAPAAKPKRTDTDVRGSADYQEQRRYQEQSRRNLGASKERGRETVGRVPVVGPVLKAVEWLTGGREDPDLALSANSFATPLPIMDEISGAGSAGVELIQNLGRMLKGERPHEVRAAYLATKDEEEDARAEYRRRHPVATTAYEIASSLGGAAVTKAPAVAGAAANGVRAGLAARTAAAAEKAAAGVRAVTPPVVARVAQGAKAATAATMNPANKAPAAKLARAVATVAQGGAAGGAFGAAHEFADAEGGLDARLEAAKEGIVPGAAAGALVTGGVMAAAPLVLGAARGATGMGRDLLRRFTTHPAEPGAPLELLPAHEAEAGDVVERMLRSTGLDDEAAIGQVHADRFANDPSATAAELMGRPGVGYVTAATRRPGATGEVFQNLYEGRARSNPGHTLEKVEGELGVSPEFAAGDIDAMVAAGRRAAAEKYDAADMDQPLVSSAAEGFLRNPAFQAGLSRAKRIAGLEGRDAYGLGLSHMDRTIDDGLPSGEALEALHPVEAEMLRAIRTGASRAVRQGPSLLEYLAKGGGLSDEGGDLAAMGAGDWHKGTPFRPKLVKPGGSSAEDDAVLKAWEAGYFPRHVESPPTREEFSEAVRRELHGQPTYSDARYDPQRLEQVRGLDQFEQRLHALGLDPAKVTDAEVASAFARERSMDDHPGNRFEPVDEFEQAGVNLGEGAPAGRIEGAPGPQVEPVPTVTPTTRTWDYMKRGMDDHVRDKYVVRTGDQKGQLELDDEGRALIGAMKRWRDGLRELNPKWGEALDTAGDYLSIQEAFGLGRGKLLGGGSVQAFGKWYAALPQGAQREAVQAAFASDILDAVNRGALRNGRFNIPGVQQKLELVFGRSRASSFVKTMEARARLMGTGARMAPNFNSTSGDALNFGAAVEGVDPAGVGAASVQALGKAGRGNLGGAIADLTVGNAMRLMSYARTTGQPVQVRDEVGRLLSMSADDLRVWLMTRQAGRPVPRPPPSMVAIGAAGGAQGARSAGQ